MLRSFDHVTIRLRSDSRMCLRLRDPFTEVASNNLRWSLHATVGKRFYVWFIVQNRSFESLAREGKTISYSTGACVFPVGCCIESVCR